MLCAICHTNADPLAASGDVVICSGCGMSYMRQADGSIQRATADDTSTLSETELLRLRQAANTVRRVRSR
jgi:hypothetical protein